MTNYVRISIILIIFYIISMHRIVIFNPLTQWAAVNIHSSEIIDPPHVDVFLYLLHFTSAIQGYSWIVALFPPTILCILPSKRKSFFFPQTRMKKFVNEIKKRNITHCLKIVNAKFYPFL